MILVVGATGNLGGEICRQLVSAGKSVRALVRATTDPAKIAALHDMGTETVQGNVRDPASLSAACAGVDTVISTVSAMPFSYDPAENNLEQVDRNGVMALIDAAKASGVGHMIYTSFSGQLDLDFPLRNAKRATEQHLKESGLTYTVLRPSFYMEAWLSPVVGFDHPNATAQIYGTGEQPISYISAGDVAQFAVACVDHPTARNAVLELGGPEALTPDQVVGIFEQASGKAFDVQYVPAEALAAQQAGAEDAMQASFAGLMRCYAAGDAIDMQETLRTFPIEMRSVQSYARSVYGGS
jgi:NADH dehydrogenase